MVLRTKAKASPPKKAVTVRKSSTTKVVTDPLYEQMLEQFSKMMLDALQTHFAEVNERLEQLEKSVGVSHTPVRNARTGKAKPTQVLSKKSKKIKMIPDVAVSTSKNGVITTKVGKSTIVICSDGKKWTLVSKIVGRKTQKLTEKEISGLVNKGFSRCSDESESDECGGESEELSGDESDNSESGSVSFSEGELSLSDD